jgi:hypothetical protein
LIAKALKVIESCQTLAQIKTAKRYAELVLQASISPAYTQIIDAAQPYFELDKELKDIIQEQRSFINKV